jgi:hypothetical protein
VESSVLEELIKNARRPDLWVMKGRKRFYTGAAESTLRNKKAALRKAASGSSKITNWLSREVDNEVTDPSNNNYQLPLDEAANSNSDEVTNPSENNHQLPFDEIADSSDDDNNFTLALLDTLLKKIPMMCGFVQ